jgi:hypothetical protein
VNPPLAHVSRRNRLTSLLVVVAAVITPFTLSHSELSAAVPSTWVSSASVERARVRVGNTIVIRASVRAPRHRTVTVRVMVQNSDGRNVALRRWRRQTFSAGERKQYRFTWAIPAARRVGTYAVTIGVLREGILRHRHNRAASFRIVPSPIQRRYTDCSTVPMATPIGALPPAMPMFCDRLMRGVRGTFINRRNSWIDDFEHNASMAELGPGYVRFEKSSLQTGRSGTFRHNNHWMADVWATNGQVGGTQMRPDRSFRFRKGKLVVVTDVAASIDAYEGFAWPEITVTTASSPASRRYGPTPARSIGDDLYAYGQFGGYDSVGIRLTGPRPIAAYYDDTERGFPCGRVWEISWFQNGESSGGGCTHPRQFDIWGGGEWVLPSGSYGDCDSADDPDTICRNLYRWELSQSKITLYINGRKLMEHTALPGVKALADQFVNSPVYVYFSDWIYQPPNRVVRYHWDRVAINP